MNYRKEIEDEFESLCSIDYSENYSLGYVLQTFNWHESDKKKSFTVEKKKKKKNAFNLTDKSLDKFTQFSTTLSVSGNIKYAMSAAGIKRQTAGYYLYLLNSECKKLGLPPFYTYKKRTGHGKLQIKQVMFIKYLVTKYSDSKVASMYGVHKSTIHLIKQGMLYKDVRPIIETGFVYGKKTDYTEYGFEFISI